MEIEDDDTLDLESQARYVRTFAGDMETVKKGGVPDLVLLKSSNASDKASQSKSPSNSESKPESIQNLEPQPQPVPMPIPNPKIQVVETPQPEPELTLHPEISIQKPEIIPEEESQQEILARLRARVDARKASQPAPPQLKSEPPKEPSPIHTYSEDFSDQVKSTHASQATLLAAEQDAATTPIELQTTKPSVSIASVSFVIGGIFLLALGAAGAYYEYMQYQKKTAPVVLAPTITAPILVNDREEISGTGTELAQTIEQSTKRFLAPGAIRFLYMANASSTRETIFNDLQLPAPGILLRNINSTGSMAGIVNSTDGAYPFFILSVTSYGDTYAGMLSWEPLMPHDLAVFYPVPTTPIQTNYLATSTATTSVQVATSSVSVASTTPPVPVVSTTSPVSLPLVFHDEVLHNHDARVYRDAFGTAVITYGYWNQTTLIIARNPVAFEEIISRLANSRSK